MAGFKFGTFKAPEKVNPYAELMEAFVAESDKRPDASHTLSVDVNDKSKEDLKFRKAANDLNRTASLKITDTAGVKPGKPDEDGHPTFTGTVELTYVLTARHKARRGTKPEESVAEAE